MVKFINIIYFIIAIFIIAFGVAVLVNGSGKLWTNICIILIGVYFIYRGIAVTVNNARRRERERQNY